MSNIANSAVFSYHSDTKSSSILAAVPPVSDEVISAETDSHSLHNCSVCVRMKR